MAQRDPLVEYQREGYDMFMAMLDGLKEESVGLLFNAQVQPGAADPATQVAPVAPPPNLAQFAAEAEAKARESGGGGVATKEAPPTVRVKGIDDDSAKPLTYTGPSEDGSAEVQRKSGGKHAAPGGGTRRERREAARKQGRGGPKARRG
jgi:preprotein translocase subunit SecA